MARIWTTGFENGDLLTLDVTAGAAAITNSLARTGTYSLVLPGSTSNAMKNISAADTYYFRFAYRTTIAGTFMRWRNSTTNLGYIALYESTLRV